DDAVWARRGGRRPWVIAGAVVGVIALGIGAFRTVRPALGPKTIAVLPFENRSAEPDSEYFSDGLTDQVIENLSVIEGLEVRSHTSSFSFKGRPRNIRAVGAQLGVQYAVEGVVARSADKLRIHAQLIRIKDDVALWSGQWDRELRDVFAIQD